MVARDPDAERIARAYYRAKAANPKLTQKEFASKAFPETTRKGRTPESAARYLRQILKGERSGERILKEATRAVGGGRGDAYQVTVRDADGNVHSFNLIASGAAAGTLDIPLIEQKLRDDPSILDAKRREYARRYKLETADLDMENFEIRRIHTIRKRAERIIVR